MHRELDEQLVDEALAGLDDRARMRVRHYLLCQYLHLKGLLTLRRLGLAKGPEESKGVRHGKFE